MARIKERQKLFLEADNVLNRCFVKVTLHYREESNDLLLDRQRLVNALLQ